MSRVSAAESFWKVWKVTRKVWKQPQTFRENIEKQRLKCSRKVWKDCSL